jgi:pimeloyl-ACP methyl ester carboxylesterase
VTSSSSSAAAAPAPRVGGVTCPVTVAHGALTDPRDPTVSLYSSAIAPVIAADLGPAAASENFPEMSHFGPLQDPESFAASVARHVARWGHQRGGGGGRGGGEGARSRL